MNSNNVYPAWKTGYQQKNPCGQFPPFLSAQRPQNMNNMYPQQMQRTGPPQHWRWPLMMPQNSETNMTMQQETAHKGWYDKSLTHARRVNSPVWMYLDHIDTMNIEEDGQFNGQDPRVAMNNNRGQQQAMVGLSVFGQGANNNTNININNITNINNNNNGGGGNHWLPPISRSQVRRRGENFVGESDIEEDPQEMDGRTFFNAEHERSAQYNGASNAVFLNTNEEDVCPLGRMSLPQSQVYDDRKEHGEEYNYPGSENTAACGPRARLSRVSMSYGPAPGDSIFDAKSVNSFAVSPNVSQSGRHGSMWATNVGRADHPAGNFPAPYGARSLNASFFRVHNPQHEVELDSISIDCDAATTQEPTGRKKRSSLGKYMVLLRKQSSKLGAEAKHQLRSFFSIFRNHWETHSSSSIKEREESDDSEDNEGPEGDALDGLSRAQSYTIGPLPPPESGSKHTRKSGKVLTQQQQQQQQEEEEEREEGSDDDHERGETEPRRKVAGKKPVVDDKHPKRLPELSGQNKLWRKKEKEDQQQQQQQPDEEGLSSEDKLKQCSGERNEGGKKKTKDVKLSGNKNYSIVREQFIDILHASVENQKQYSSRSESPQKPPGKALNTGPTEKKNDNNIDPVNTEKETYVPRLPALTNKIYISCPPVHHSEVEHIIPGFPMDYHL